ncbi:intestine-specific homeobox-like protein [Dinothrombium tinctorium]|uniref:Intestine-specific homeobox-like protein n=1 Tax=Dinothrombium tinctorium TaxID=1965070 RepID=A0A443QFT6_9ACAR|nr:intestine-specific homeobox-like protein [Dinothrombium tinctorium]
MNSGSENQFFTQVPTPSDHQLNSHLESFGKPIAVAGESSFTNHFEYGSQISFDESCYGESLNANIMQSSTSDEKRVNNSGKSINFKRRFRNNFTIHQTSILERVFEQSTHYPDYSTLSQISKQLKLPISRIQVWFQNRRAKFRRNSAASGHLKMKR